MPVDKVWFHTSFQYGKVDTEYFQDLPYINDTHFNLVENFVIDVLSGNELHGRNKPSWLDRDGNVIQSAATYQQCNIWHYHIGDHDTSLNPLTKNIRNQNLAEQVSSEILHYTWQGNETSELIILGFSPTHEDFLLGNDKRNPLRSRVSPVKYPSSKLINPLDPNND